MKQRVTQPRTTPSHAGDVLTYPSDIVLPKTMQQFYDYLERKPRLHHLHQRLLKWDARLTIRANRWSHRELIGQFFKVISRLGDGWFWAAAVITMIGVLAVQGRAPLSIALATLVILLTSYSGYRLYRFLKRHTVRPRPYQVHQVIVLKERPLDVFSFPSGHTLQAVLFTLLIGSQTPVLLWVLAPFTALVALSRLVLGLHYPTDVLVGAGIGASFAMAAQLVLTLV